MASQSDDPDATDEGNRLGRQLLSTGATDVVGFLAALVFSIIVARWLQPTGKGFFSATMAGVVIAANLATLGLPKALLYHVAKSGRDGRRLLGTALVILPALLVLGLACFLLVGPSLPSGDALGVTLIALGILALMLLSAQIESALRALRHIGSVNLAALTYSLAQLALVGAVGLAVALTYPLALGLVLVAWILRAVVAARFVSRDAALRPRWRFDREAGAMLLRFGVPYQMYAFVWALHTKIDVVLLENWSGAESSGYYATGVNLAQMMWRLPIVITFVTMPFITQLKERGKASEVTALTCRLLTPLVVVGGALLFVLAEPIVTLLYGESFAPSAHPLRIVVPGVVASVLYLIMVGELAARNELRPLFLLGAAGTLVNLALNVWLIPTYAEGGAAIASSVSYTLSFLLVLGYLAWRHERPLRDYLWATRADLALIRRRVRRG